MRRELACVNESLKIPESPPPDHPQFGAPAPPHPNVVKVDTLFPPSPTTTLNCSPPFTASFHSAYHPAAPVKFQSAEPVPPAAPQAFTSILVTSAGII
jgi:hypothetical protein